MPLIDLDIPAGVMRNGTDLQSNGRWRDASLVRWHDGVMRPIKGWRTRSENATDAKVRGLFNWADNTSNNYTAGGTYKKLYVWEASGDLLDITPTSVLAGYEDAQAFTGFGGGFYGYSTYGTARPITSSITPATSWQLDSWGQYLIACSDFDKTIYEWQLDGVAGSELVTNGDFALGTSWTTGTHWSIAGGVAEYQQLIGTFDADNATDADVSTDTITITAHGFSDGDEVQYVVPAAPATALGGLVDGANYFVVNSTTNTLQLAATSGGAAINLTRNALTFDGDDATVVDVANDKIVNANTFTTGDYVTYSNGGGVDIGGLTDGANYYVIAATASEFQLSLTSGGAAIDLTANNSVTIDSADVAVVDVANDKIITANTFTDGEIVTYDNGGGTDIGGLVNGTDYYIINATATEFQLSATSGGAAITITAVGVGAAHVFRQDIGSSHTFTVDHGAGHALERQDYGNLEQTVSGLTTSPTDWAHDIIVTLIDPNDDADATTIPAPTVKVTGTTSTTVLVNQTLSVGLNRFRFQADDTEVKIEIIPSAANEPNFDIDDVSLRQYPTALPVANAPEATGIVVTDERFLFALGADGNGRRVEWSDRENNTVWTPTTENEAGGYELETAGDILLGKVTLGQTLIVTTRDAHVAKYIGPPYVYSFERIGTDCGGISKHCATTFDGGSAWMGLNSFFLYSGGVVQKLPSDVSDYVFNDINRAQISKVFAMTNSSFNEIWWFYPSGTSLENDRYVAWNYAENIWMTGNLARTAGSSRGPFDYPIMFNPSDLKIYEHEVSYNYSGDKPYAETGPIRIGTGDQIMKVTKLIPDEQNQGDVKAKFKSRFYPNGTERDYGPYTMSNPTSVRFSGRQIRLRIEGENLDDWRVGINRIDVIAGGRR